LTSAAVPAANRVVITSVVKCSMAIMVTLLYFGMLNRTTHTTAKTKQANGLFVREQAALWEEQHDVAALTQRPCVWRRVQERRNLDIAS
jgi:hypothetical protein